MEAQTATPDHLASIPWYAPHQAWLREAGLLHHDPGGAAPVRANLSDANISNTDLSGANLSDAILLRADFSDANLSHAILLRATLTGACLRGANLSGADLLRANLTRADLLGANLTRALLWDANLTRATLTRATLTRANLTFTILTGASLTSANLSGAIGAADIPRAPIPGLAAAVLAQIEQHPETYDQKFWHSECETKHCVAGWAVQLAGDIGREAEARLGTSSAAALLLGGVNHPFGAAADPLPWLRKMAGVPGGNED